MRSATSISGSSASSTTRRPTRLRYFAQSLFAGHTAAAVDEFMRFLTPSARTDLRAARRDLIDGDEQLRRERARRSGAGSVPTEDIFEMEMLAVVRRHHMALNPDAVRYLKAVLTAEAMVKELDPRVRPAGLRESVLRTSDGARGGRSAGSAAMGQAVIEARARVERVLDAIESVGETPRELFSVVLNGAAPGSAVLVAHHRRLGRTRDDRVDRARRYRHEHADVDRRVDQRRPCGIPDSRGAPAAVGIRGRPSVPVSPPPALTSTATNQKRTRRRGGGS